MKDVAHAIWSTKSIERAQTDLLNALNDNRNEQLSTDEHMAIARYTGHFDWLYYVCHRCNHSRPVPITPEERAAELQERVMRLIGELKPVLAEFDQIKPSLRVVGQ
jgi:hypothetical protein